MLMELQMQKALRSPRARKSALPRLTSISIVLCLCNVFSRELSLGNPGLECSFLSVSLAGSSQMSSDQPEVSPSQGWGMSASHSCVSP